MVISYSPIAWLEDGRHRSGLPQWLAPVPLPCQFHCQFRCWRRLLERPSAREVAFSGTPFPVVAGKREIAGHSHRRAPSVPIQWQKTAGPRSTSKIDRNSFPPNKPGRGQTRFPPASKSRQSKFVLAWGLLPQRDRRRLRAATNATPAIPSRVAGAGSGITEAALISQ